MDCRHGKTRENVVGDRLSILPDDLIHRILSFLSTRHAIETSVLSSRWRYNWKSMPYLNFPSEDLLDLPKFHLFVNHVLSHRNNQVKVSSINISFQQVNWVLVKRILRYAHSHKVQRLIVGCMFEEKINFPLFVFHSRSLKHLTLTGSSKAAHLCTRASSWELLALTTLRLDYVTLYDYNTVECNSLFSKCINLQDLTLNHCIVRGSDKLCICHPQLLNLTLEYVEGSMISVNVVAPQLVNLTIRNCIGEYLISAPDLASLIFEGYDLLQFSADGVPTLQRVVLCICNPYNEDASRIVGLIQQLHSVKFLTLNSELVEFLSSFMQPFARQPSPFANLKSVKVYPDNVFWDVEYTMSTDAINYLLDGSPNAAFTVVSCEEIRAVMNKTRAQKLMVDLRVMLEQEKANFEANRAHINQESAQPGAQMQLHIQGRMTQMKSCWEDMSVHVEQGKAKTCRIFSKLQEIEKLMTCIPASKRAKIQPCFSSLCAEADAVTSKIIDCIKIQCDKEQNGLSVYLHELATASQPPS